MKFRLNDNTAFLIALVSSFLLALNAMLGFVLTTQSKAAMKTLFQNRVLGIANTAAAMINGNELELLEAEDKGTPPYRRVNDTLTYFQNNIDLEYIYCVRAVDENNFVFTVDPTVYDPGEFGSPVVSIEALRKAAKGIPAVDFRAEWYEDQIEKQINTIIICRAVSLVLCVLAVLFVTKHLRQRVKDMTIDLRSALNAAESANRAKTSFLSAMSHDIRTPLNAIIGLDHIALQNKDLPELARDQLQKIGASAHHLLALINDILDMSRIESGRTVLKHEEFSFAQMLEQVNVIIGSQCRDKGLNYACRISDSLDENYVGDSVKLKQVLINVLGNAVKFTPEGGTVSFDAECIERIEHRAAIRFLIKDTGIGMSKEYLPKIFETFSRENSSAENKYGSTGLGMAITKSLVEMMDGTVSVESEKGVGTAFTVVVVLDQSQARTQASEPDEAIPSKPRAELSGRRILLAEDIEINAEIMKEVLKMRGMLVELAENGRRAVDMFNAQPIGYYDAILMDMHMPVINGLEATKLIRALDRTDAKSIPIIALTANAFDEDVQRSMQAGMNAHLLKPIEPDAIYRTLEELIV